VPIGAKYSNKFGEHFPVMGIFNQVQALRKIRPTALLASFAISGLSDR